MASVNSITVQCCVCKKIRTGSEWITQEKAEIAEELVSHGYCPKCADEAFKAVLSITRSCNVAAAV